MSGPHRLERGGRIDRGSEIAFRFDGRSYRGHPGDTLASALLANGVRIFGRSFKYHRPRGVVTAGPEEPCALVELRAGARREANLPATTVELYDGLEAWSQSRWPSLAFDLGAMSGLLAPFIPAGFYYKTFMWPPAFWERVYEPLIRRAAGLGRAASEPDPDRYETVHAFCDVAVIGAGEEGIAAAQAAAAAEKRVMILERDFDAGGALLLEPAREMERQERLAALARAGAVILTRTTAFGLYDHGVVGAVERVSDHVAQPGPGEVRQRQWVIRAGETIEATGALERLLAFPGNDRPGVMLAGAAETYAVRFGVAAGRRAVLFTNNDAAYRSALALAERGVSIEAIVEAREDSEAGRLAQRAGIPVRFASEIIATIGAPVRAVSVRPRGRTTAERISCDLVLMSGGREPVMVPGARDGRALRAGEPPSLFEVRARGKSFVDLQNDVTADDIRLAAREGYAHVEHAKRYTTHGMGTDQGKIGGAIGAAVLAEARGVPAATVGLATARPFASPVTWGALAGAETSEHFRPKRRLALHERHERHGAVFVRLGLWLRPLVYSADSGWDPVLAEARAVRRSVGVTDVSSLGKIDVQGRDAATFLDRIYANRFSTLPVGKARYGVMLREDGMVFDDGTTSRLGERHFVVTTTTANAASVLQHLEFHHDTVWPDLDVRLSDISEQWAQIAIAGPRSRAVLASLGERDLSDEAFQFMAAGEALIAGIPGRIFRISFSGELAYEIAVPAAHAETAWDAVLAAGAPYDIRPYGLDALNVLRIEKGHVAGSEINGETTARDVGLERLLKKEGDFVGRVLATRPSLVDPDRPALVGIRARDPAATIRAGAHLVADASARDSQGFLTAACPGTDGQGVIALALLRGGPARIGERLYATDPVRGSGCHVEVTSPHFVDPENRRVKGEDGGA